MNKWTSSSVLVVFLLLSLWVQPLQAGAPTAADVYGDYSGPTSSDGLLTLVGIGLFILVTFLLGAFLSGATSVEDAFIRGFIILLILATVFAVLSNLVGRAWAGLLVGVFVFYEFFPILKSFFRSTESPKEDSTSADSNQSETPFKGSLTSLPVVNGDEVSQSSPTTTTTSPTKNAPATPYPNLSESAKAIVDTQRKIYDQGKWQTNTGLEKATETTPSTSVKAVSDSEGLRCRTCGHIFQADWLSPRCPICDQTEKEPVRVNECKTCGHIFKTDWHPPRCPICDRREKTARGLVRLAVARWRHWQIW
uniref:hypothetical protein n=1 Tax=Shewanella sp. TaxID=50422 RepID=UPI004047799E